MAERELAILISARDMASRTIKGVKKELGGLDKNVNRLGRGTSAAIGNIEKGVAVGAGAAVAGLAYSVNAAVEFESAFAGVRKTVDETDLTAAGLSFQDLSDDIREMAREMPISANEIAGLAEAAGALGIKAQDISEFTRVTALLGVTTDVTAQDAATSLGQLSNVMGLTNADYERFGSTLVGLGNAGASTESAILGVAQRAGGLASAAGFSADQVLGWSSAVANLGMNEELAGSSIQRFIGKAIEAVGTGGKKLKAFAKTAGMTGKQFQKAFAEDASAALEDVVEGLAKLPVEERTQALKEMGLTGVGLTTMFSGLTTNVDNLNDSLDNGERFWDENTAMSKEAEERFKTTASSLTILKNNLHDAAITIGSELLPELATLAKEGTGWLQDNQPAVKQFAKDIAGGIRDAVGYAKSLDWEAIGGALKAGATGAKMLVDAFLAAPPWLQGFLATGFVANKFTGGMIGDVVGELAKGAIKGVLGMNAGVVNINAGVVNGAGGVPGAAGKGGGALAGAGRLLVGLTGVGIVAGLASEFEDEIQGVAEGISTGWRGAVEDVLGVKIPTISPNDLEWPLGPKNAPEWAGGSTAPTKNRGTYHPPTTPQGSGDPRLQPNAAEKAMVAAQATANQKLSQIHTVSAEGTRAAFDTKVIASGQARTLLEAKQAAVTNAAIVASAQARSAAEQKQAIAAGAAQQAASLQVMGLTIAVSQASAAIRTSLATIGAGARTAAAAQTSASRIVAAINGLDLSVNVTTVNRTSTVNNRYGPSGGSGTTSRIPGSGR